MLIFGTIYTFPVMMFLGYLTSYHIWLKVVGKSTYEHILEIRMRDKENADKKKLVTKVKAEDINKKFDDAFSFDS